MVPPPGFRRAHAQVPPGTWSDDGAQALCLFASLLECGRLDVEDFGQRLVRWYREGYMAVDGIVFDIGIQSARAIQALIDGIPATGLADERANGNGSLMRVLPLALWHQGADEELIRDACAQSVVTHGHRRSQICCALYCLWARREMEGSPTAWDDAVSAIDDPELAVILEPARPTGTGYVVDCLRSARYACEASSYAEVVRRAIALGHDTDTTACVAGGIAGIRHGRAGIPEAWQRALRGTEVIHHLISKSQRIETR